MNGGRANAKVLAALLALFGGIALASIGAVTLYSAYYMHQVKNLEATIFDFKARLIWLLAAALCISAGLHVADGPRLRWWLICTNLLAMGLFLLAFILDIALIPS